MFRHAKKTSFLNVAIILALISFPLVSWGSANGATTQSQHVVWSGWTVPTVSDSNSSFAPYQSTVDSLGDVYILGGFNGTQDFDPTSGVDSQTVDGYFGTYLTKYASDGTYEWTRVWDNSMPIQLATDDLGDVVISAYSSIDGTIDLDPTSGTDNRTTIHQNNSLTDTFIAFIHANGNYGWGNLIGVATQRDAQYGYAYYQNLAVSPNGTVSAVGSFEQSISFDHGTSDTLETPFVPEDTFWHIPEPFLSQWSVDGTYEGTKTWNNTDGTTVYVSTDADSNVYVSSSYAGPVSFDPHSTNTTTGLKSSGIAISTFDSTGQYVSTDINNVNSVDYISPVYDEGIKLDNDGNRYIRLGLINSVDIDLGGTPTTLDAGNYIVKLTSDGVLAWVYSLNSIVAAYSWDVTPQGHIILAGYFTGVSSFTQSDGSIYQVTGDPAFVAQYDTNASLISADVWGPNYTYVMPLTVATSRDGAIYIAGLGHTDGQYDPYSGQTFSEDSSAFLSKWGTASNVDDVTTTTSVTTTTNATTTSTTATTVPPLDVTSTTRVPQKVTDTTVPTTSSPVSETTTLPGKVGGVSDPEVPPTVKGTEKTRTPPPSHHTHHKKTFLTIGGLAIGGIEGLAAIIFAIIILCIGLFFFAAGRRHKRDALTDESRPQEHPTTWL